MRIEALEGELSALTNKPAALEVRRDWRWQLIVAMSLFAASAMAYAVHLRSAHDAATRTIVVLQARLDRADGDAAIERQKTNAAMEMIAQSEVVERDVPIPYPARLPGVQNPFDAAAATIVAVSNEPVSVVLNGRTVSDTTPIRLKVVAGEHKVDFVRNGEVRSKEVTVAADSMRFVSARF